MHSGGATLIGVAAERGLRAAIATADRRPSDAVRAAADSVLTVETNDRAALETAGSHCTGPSRSRPCECATGWLVLAALFALLGLAAPPLVRGLEKARARTEPAPA
ncbi:hypothetical protein [Streptomyces sp. NPDC029041]|uniref:hypothetical protein n=1 Tax=Streptomyces sp. NPDC029041 TaxID=3155727 RepID=UPI0033C205D6